MADVYHTTAKATPGDLILETRSTQAGLSIQFWFLTNSDPLSLCCEGQNKGRT